MEDKLSQRTCRWHDEGQTLGGHTLARAHTSGGTGALTQAVPGACPPLVPSRACLPLSWTGPLPPWGTRAGPPRHHVPLLIPRIVRACPTSRPRHVPPGVGRRDATGDGTSPRSCWRRASGRVLRLACFVRTRAWKGRGVGHWSCEHSPFHVGQIVASGMTPER